MVSSVFVHPGIDKVSVLAQGSLAGSCVHEAMSVQLQRLGWSQGGWVDRAGDVVAHPVPHSGRIFVVDVVVRAEVTDCHLTSKSLPVKSDQTVPTTQKICEEK